MNEIVKNIESLKSLQVNFNKVFKPEFYRIYKSTDLIKFNDILNTPGIFVFDYLYDQLKELVKFNNPSKKFTTFELEQEVNTHIGNVSIYEYGVWIYYPWSNRLVHVLDEDEFIDIRTSRNQYKITREERDALVNKKIGVIGLSVGQSVSVTIAMERICGEIRLADFDLLELTNLNRIRTGIHNLSLAKVYSVAREISEIDPFLKVVCFPDGLNEENMDDFFMKDGKLDLLIEESDGFDIKILSRYKARALNIPVLMEASDRCTVDVERFDLEPNREILHGLVNHLNIDVLKSLKTTEEKIPYMLDVLGIETSSLRLRASMLEIEESINTWPQLASAVTMGGGIATDVARRILLNQFNHSGRYHVDIEELIGNTSDLKNCTTENKEIEIISKKSLSHSEMLHIVNSLISNTNFNAAFLSNSQIKIIVEAAIMAPSGGNAQAWKWIYQQGQLFLFHDIERSESLLDFNNYASYMSFGAALENLVLKSHELNIFPNLNYFPLSSEPRLVCQITFFEQHNNIENRNFDYLVSHINNRLTNRTISEIKPIDKLKLDKIKQIASTIKGFELNVIENKEEIDILSNVISGVERLRMMNIRGHQDFVNEIRWNDSENELKRDGIDLRTVEISAAEKAGFIVAKNWNVVKTLKDWRKGSAFEKLSKKAVKNSSAICILTINKYSALEFLDAGRIIQRIWLEASYMNISFQPLSPATFFFARLFDGNGIGLDDESQDILRQYKKDIAKILSFESDRVEAFIFRLFISDKPVVKSLRRDINDVLILS